MKEIFFNADHSPIGAFSSFTLGYPGAKGGLGMELGKPADQNVFIGLQTADGKYYEALPFFDYSEDESKRFDIEKLEQGDKPSVLVWFDKNCVTRQFNLATDTWNAGDLEFKIYSPIRSVPDPEKSIDMEMKKAIVPAVFAEVTVDNTGNKNWRRVFIGYKASIPNSGMRKIYINDGQICGVGEGRNTAIVSKGENVRVANGFSMEDILGNQLVENWTMTLGNCGALILDIPPGQKVTFPVAICFYRDGIVTTGIDAAYYYTKFFRNLEDVAEFTMNNFNDLVDACKEDEKLIEGYNLPDAKKFMLCQAARSYYASTEFLCYNGKPLWVVNEGEYRMMNTLDLTVDMLFYELRMNPWTVRNVLDMFSERYSYEDTLRFPNDNKEFPGGISFTHDMGVINNFSRPGYSSYEMYGKTGCFSHMTHEELVNWCCCAFGYYNATNDLKWMDKNIDLLKSCFQSMVNRDAPDAGERDGIMSLDSSRTMGGAEITTYDSLDASLGQARNNVYMAGKCWALYVLFDSLFNERGMMDFAELAKAQARKCVDTIIKNSDKKDYIPAIIGEGIEAAIIPAVEGLIFPYIAGLKDVVSENGPYGDYIKLLKKHIKAVMKPGICIFEDGGWKISSTSNNSWPSKIYLCKFIISDILDIDADSFSKDADEVHKSWLLRGENAYWCFSDQFILGEAIGSKYYPRGVTNILWLYKK
ncbi:MAG TPA: glycoside hydrolase family 52 protein [Pseudobacteroides sp.]|uniref:glycoside hydrolase family 52 protein n=1 Tax=Pseudobacteroides sp. TaxID=1968840 RepID=UPI002F934CAE